MNANFLVQRLLHSALVLWGTLTIVFLIVRLVPGDPVRIMAGPDAGPAQIEDMRRALGLDRSIPVQYATYLMRVVQGDLGSSIRHHKGAFQLIFDYLPKTLLLAAVSMLWATTFGVALGIVSAMKRGGFVDLLAGIVSLIGQSVPTFWLGIMLIMIFAVSLRVLPTSGYGQWQNIVLPSFTLGLYMMALITRMCRSSVLDTLGAEYLRTARAKGLSEKTILLRHVLRNSMIPVITVIGLQTGTLLGGAVITETVFAWPGIGSLAVDSITTLDYPVVQAVVVLSSIVFVVINLLLDICYTLIDPRIRYA
jgi:peptide/nickel transport system permease protein